MSTAHCAGNQRPRTLGLAGWSTVLIAGATLLALFSLSTHSGAVGSGAPNPADAISSGFIDGPAAIGFHLPTADFHVADSVADEVWVFTTGGTIYSSYGINLDEPRGIDVTPSRSYVANAGSARVEIFNSMTRAHVGGFGGWGAAPQNLNAPWDVAHTGSELVVSDTGNSRLARFTPTGSYIGDYQGDPAFGSLDDPRGLAIDNGGVLHVVDPGRGSIVRVNATTWNFVDEIPLTYAGPTGISISNTDEIWVTYDATVEVYSPSGTLLNTIALVEGGAFDVWVDPSGLSFWVTAFSDQLVRPWSWNTCDGLALSSVGTSYDDNLIGVDGVVHAGAGDDGISLSGTAGGVVCGGSGDDQIFGTTGPDVIWGGGGADEITAKGGDDEIHGEAGVDDIDGGFGDDLIMGGSGADLIMGGPGRDEVFGGLGNNTIHGGPDNDVLRGDDGRDDIYGEDGADLIYGKGGNDFLWGGDGVDRIFGLDGNDYLAGDSGDDRMYGGSGDDDLHGGDGVDRLYGQSGADDVHGDLGNDILYGGAGDDVVRGGTGDDRMYGQSEVDQLFGDDGDDIIYGGAHNDVASGGADSDMIYGQGGADVLSGGDGPDTLTGGTGNDALNGGNGNDVLQGQTGNDDLHGGPGINDDCYGGAGTDTAVGCESFVGIP